MNANEKTIKELIDKNEDIYDVAISLLQEDNNMGYSLIFNTMIEILKKQRNEMAQICKNINVNGNIQQIGDSECVFNYSDIQTIQKLIENYKNNEHSKQILERINNETNKA